MRFRPADQGQGGLVGGTIGCLQLLCCARPGYAVEPLARLPEIVQSAERDKAPVIVGGANAGEIVVAAEGAGTSLMNQAHKDTSLPACRFQPVESRQVPAAACMQQRIRHPPD